MYCTKCGAHLDDSARFCTSCGQAAGGQHVHYDPSHATPEPAPGAPRRKLRRDMSRKRIAGVCAGFAEYFDTDITWLRVIWVLLSVLPPHLGVIAYIVSWAVLPRSDKQ